MTNEIIGILGTVNAFLLGGLVTFQWKIWGRLDKMRDTFDSKRTIHDCKIEQERCFKQFDNKIDCLENTDKELWNALAGHSHTGLTADAKVTR